MSKTKILRALKAKSPTILTICAAVGFVSTVVLVAKAAPKAAKKVEKMREPVTVYYDNEPVTVTPPEPTKKDIIKAVWKDFIPAAAVGVGTLVCIFGANMLSRHSQAMITSAYAVLNNQYQRYSDAVKRKFGEETHEEILNSTELVAPKDITIAETVKDTAIAFDPEDENEVLFYDLMSKRYFKSTIGRVMNAIHQINRNLCLGGDPEVNLYYDFLGLDDVEYGDNIGWTIDSMYWIDFEIFKQKVDDDTLECYVINPIFWPEPFETT